MTLLAATAMSLVVLAPLCAVAMQGTPAPAITVSRAGSQPSRSGPAADWMEKVSDEQYRAGLSAE